MSTSILPLRRMSLPWRGSKATKTTTTATQVEIDQTTDSIQLPSQWIHDEPQSSPLLALPIEIQDQIYDHILNPWTMALLSHTSQYEDITTNKTIDLRTVGTHLISGPPGTPLLLVCRAMYHAFNRHYGRACTGTLILGRVRGWARRRLPHFLSTTFKLQRFYDQITRLSVDLDLDNARIGLDFRNLLPNLKRVDCIVHEGNYGPLLRLMDTAANFVRGHHDREIVDWTKPAVNYFLCVDSRSMPPIHRASSPWDDATAVVNVRVLGSIASDSKAILGLHYRWEGSRVVVVSRVVRDATGMAYSEVGTEGRHDIMQPRIVPVSNELLQTYGWVKSLK